MTLKLPFAAVLRAIRSKRGITQESLSEAGSRTYLGALERGESSISLDKLQVLSQTLQLSPLTLIALTLSTLDEQPIGPIVERLSAELEEFERIGGLEELKAQIADGILVSRKAGKLVDTQRLMAVHQCKADGLSQKETAVRLGLSKSTVHDLWKRPAQK
jgi:transcriptional regulator with XRE-family HTH domain